MIMRIKQGYSPFSILARLGPSRPPVPSHSTWQHLAPPVSPVRASDDLRLFPQRTFAYSSWQASQRPSPLSTGAFARGLDHSLCASHLSGPCSNSRRLTPSSYHGHHSLSESDTLARMGTMRELSSVPVAAYRVSLDLARDREIDKTRCCGTRHWMNQAPLPSINMFLVTMPRD